jgi:Tol biopolymer transport system component
MTRTRLGSAAAVIVVVTIGAGATFAVTQPQRPAAKAVQILMGTALHQEEVEGNLAGAILTYKMVIADRRAGRTTLATAWVRLGRCYERLGNAEARQAYERVISDFGEQTEAVALARTRLAASGIITATKTRRTVWTGPYVDMYGRVSSDGRYITFVDWTRTTNLMVHDLVSDTDRALTANPPWAGNPSWVWSGGAEYSVISRDGSHVAYAWQNAQGLYELLVVALQTTGLPRSRTLIAGNQDVRSLTPRDWSPDGKWIATEITRKDRTTQIALVAAANGSVSVLKSTDWRGPSRIVFAPDGKYLAYDVATSTGAQQDIFILAIDGSRESPAVVDVADDKLMGWSPDGRHVLFSSDRGRAVDLWGLPVSNGKPQGPPELLEPNLGSARSLGVTASGALYLYRGISTRDVKTAPIDLEAGKLLGPPASFTQGFIDGARDPAWSPDGRYLAYQACEGGCVAIRTVATGHVRRLPAVIGYPRDPRWSHDGRSLLITGVNLRERRAGLFRVDAQSGEATALLTGDGLRGPAQSSPDGTKLYFIREGASLERDLTSGVERKLPLAGVLSPDGRYLASRRDDAAAKASSLVFVPVAGDQPRELLRLTQPEALQQRPVWTPDSRAVLAVKSTRSRRELWMIPLSGSPRMLDVDPGLWMDRAVEDGLGTDQGFALSPDGRHIAFLMGKQAAEVWALQNFLPVPRNNRK